LALADFTGDGVLDVAVTGKSSVGTDAINVLRGDGTGNFAPLFSYLLLAGEFGADVAAGDFNSDGKIDLAVAVGNFSAGPNSARFLQNDGTGTFTDFASGPFASGASGVAIAVADVNGDSKLDVVLGQNSDEIAVLLGQGNGAFTATPLQPDLAFATLAGVAISDFNNDSKLDVIGLYGESGNLAVFQQDAGGKFVEAYPAAEAPTVPTGSSTLAVADFDGDALPDVAVVFSGSLSGVAQIRNISTGGQIRLLNDGQFSFTTASPFGIVAGDLFTGGAGADLVVAELGSNGILVLRNTSSAGALSFADGGKFTADGPALNVALGQVDGDTTLDAVVTTISFGKIAVLLNGTGTTTTLSATPNPSTVGQLVTLSAQVTPFITGGPTPTGSVAFFDGGTLIGSGTLDATGKAVLSSSTLPGGTYTFTARYAGNADYITSSALPVLQTITPADTVITLSVDPNSANAGSVFTLTASIGVTTPGTTVLISGTTVTFFDGATVLGTTAVSNLGQATLSTNSLPVGTRTLTAQLNGNGDYNGSTSPPVTATVTNVPPPVNTAPLAVNDRFTTPFNTPLVVAAPGVLANDVDGQNDPLTANLVFGPQSFQGTITLAPDGSFTFTPTMGFCGEVNIVYRVNDGTVDGNTALLTIQVMMPPRPADALLAVAGQTQVNTYTFAADGTTVAASTNFTPFPGVGGFVRVAVGDFNADAVADTAYVTGPGGGALVRIVNGKDGTDLLTGNIIDLFPNEDLTNIGLFVAAGDFDGDQVDELVVSPDKSGGPRVRAFRYGNGALTQLIDFLGIEDPNFRGGARVAVGDLDGDCKADLIVGAGFEGGPRVAVYQGTSITAATPRKFVGDFFIFEQSLRNGVFLAAGDLDGDGKAELIAGAGPGGGPRVVAYRFADIEANIRQFGNGDNLAQAPAFTNFFAFNSDQRGGVRPITKDLDGDGKLDLVAGNGDNSAPLVATYNSSSVAGDGTPPSAAVETFSAFNFASVATGVFVG
jgi:hypothetical protein